MRKTRIEQLLKHYSVLRKYIDLRTQELRVKIISRLEVMFNYAYQMAVSQHTENRDEWMKIAGYIAQVINSVTNSFDEVRFNEDMKRLRDMIEAAKKRAAGTREGTAETN
ncbi:hypothetical protein KEJ33_01770, partial [Candidatus Bathyarchaeota archaeon]|nr:hypothetical protein [Candidatus Bathyarchaeota archaeon]